MSTLSISLPDPLHEMAQEIAKGDHISLNQFIASAVAEKIAALATETYLATRAARGSVKKFRSALEKVPDVEPEVFDRKSD